MEASTGLTDPVQSHQGCPSPAPSSGPLGQSAPAPAVLESGSTEATPLAVAGVGFEHTKSRVLYKHAYNLATTVCVKQGKPRSLPSRSKDQG